MRHFWIVVKSPDERLYRALEEAFLGRTDFSVVRERRRNAPEIRAGERRKARIWETGELVFAESDN